MATPRIQWIQYNELVLGENNPTGEPDNDNRPLKQIVIFSNLNPQAEDFPGFIGCYQGTSDPNGIQTGNVRNSFWDAANGEFWMKQTGDNTNTGWIKIGGVGGDHLIGNGSPDGVKTADHVGKYYDQLDSDAGHPSWVKRDICVLVPYASEWFNGADDADIATPARLLDGGTDISFKHGSWVRHPLVAGIINITSPGSPGGSEAAPATAAESLYYVTGLSLTNADYAVRITVNVLGEWDDNFTTTLSNQKVGVGIRFDTATVSGYIAELDIGVGSGMNIRLNKYVAGVKTTLETVALEIDTVYDTHTSVDIRAIASVIEVWVGGRKRIRVTDATYALVGVPVIYFKDAKTTQIEPDIRIPDLTIYNITQPNAETGWFSQNGFQYNYSIIIGDNASANYLNLQGDIAIGANAISSSSQSQLPNPGDIEDLSGNIAIGANAQATGFSDCIAIGAFYPTAQGRNSIAIGSFTIARGEDSTTIGFSSSAFGFSSSAYGTSALAGGPSSIAIGDSSEADASYGIAIGAGATVSGFNGFPWILGGIAIGAEASVEFDYSIAIGHGAEITAANQLLLGGYWADSGWDANQDSNTTPLQGINTVIMGWGDEFTASTPLALRKTNASGTNVAAGDFTIQAGRSTGTATQGNIVFQTGTPIGTGGVKQTLATRLTIHNFGITVSGNVVQSISTLVYSVAITPNAALGKLQVVTVTDGVAFAINAPTNPITGQELTFVIRNTSGGAVGVITWNAVFKMGVFVTSATANSRSITFYYNGTNWVEISKIVADVPN